MYVVCRTLTQKLQAATSKTFRIFMGAQYRSDWKNSNKQAKNVIGFWVHQRPSLVNLLVVSLLPGLADQEFYLIMLCSSKLSVHWSVIINENHICWNNKLQRYLGKGNDLNEIIQSNSSGLQE